MKYPCGGRDRLAGSVRTTCAESSGDGLSHTIIPPTRSPANTNHRCPDRYCPAESLRKSSMSFAARIASVIFRSGAIVYQPGAAMNAPNGSMRHDRRMPKTTLVVLFVVDCGGGTRALGPLVSAPGGAAGAAVVMGGGPARMMPAG